MYKLFDFFFSGIYLSNTSVIVSKVKKVLFTTKAYKCDEPYIIYVDVLRGIY